MKIKFRYILSIGLLLLGLFELYHWYNVKDNKVEIEATVTDVKLCTQVSRYTSNSKYYKISIVYEYNGKKNTTFINDKEYTDIDGKNVKKGDVLKLYINPNNIYEVVNEDYMLSMALGSIALGGVLLFIFIKIGKNEKLSPEEREKISRMVQERRLPRE